MKNILNIFAREIREYFNSAIAYIFIIVFLFMSGGTFMTQFFLISVADIRGFFNIFPVLLCVFIPAITMRLWAEDRKENTLELLLTFPFSTFELAMGKFLASFAFYFIALISTFTIPIMLTVLGRPDIGIIVCQYMGTMLLGMFFLAFGIFISGFCKDQIVAFIVSMLGCFAFFLLGIDFTAGSIDGWMPGFGTFLQSALGMTQHFEAFQKGIIDARDFLYFLAGAAIFVMLNVFWMDTRLKPRSKSFFTTAVLISITIFSIINFVLIDFTAVRFDLTEGKLYTVSGSAKKILKSLEAPVTAKLYISPPDKMPGGMKTLERDIRDKLDEFRVASNGKFNYKVFYMEPSAQGAKDGSLEKSVMEKGIRPFQVQSIEADEVGVKLIYSAVALAYKEKPDQIIPRVAPSDIYNLEYTVISTIYKMILDRKPQVALVAPYSEREIDPKMKELMQAMGQGMRDKLIDDEYELIPKLLEYEGYSVSRIKLTEKEPIPQGTETLVIVEPSSLNDRQRFEINKFLTSGGNVFLAVQNYDYKYYPSGMGITISAADKDPGVKELLEKWGLGVSKKLLMDSQCDVISLTGGNFLGIFSMSTPVKIPVHIKIADSQMNRDVSITSRLAAILYLWGTAIEADDKALIDKGLEKIDLFTSSRGAWEVEYHPGNLEEKDFTPPARSEQKTFLLAALFKGQFPDAFKGASRPAWPKPEGEAAIDGGESYEKKEEKIEIKPNPGKLIITGCAKMFDRELFDKGGQMAFFLNSVDLLTLGEELIEIRSKQPINRSLGKISSAMKGWWRIFTTVLVPLVLCVIGAVRIFMRKKAKWDYARGGA